MGPKRNPYNLEPPGRHFGKTDQERMGVFMEMEYLIGDPYISPGDAVKDPRVKGAQMHPGFPKSKPDGYFQEKFLRVFEKEGYSDPLKRELQDAMASKKLDRGKGFVPPGPTKQHSCPGDDFGTFGPKLEAVSPLLVKRPPRVPEKPNFYTNPGKKGGCGYIDITLSKYPEHLPDPYGAGAVLARKNFLEEKRKYGGKPFLATHHPSAYFDVNPFFTAPDKLAPVYKIPKREELNSKKWMPSSPTKWGLVDGCFSKFPAYETGKEKKSKEPSKEAKTTKIFYPSMRMKPMRTTSIVTHNIGFRVNAKNWTTYQPTVYPAKMQKKYL